MEENEIEEFIEKLKRKFEKEYNLSFEKCNCDVCTIPYEEGPCLMKFGFREWVVEKLKKLIIFSKEMHDMYNKIFLETQKTEKNDYSERILSILESTSNNTDKYYKDFLKIIEE